MKSSGFWILSASLLFAAAATDCSMRSPPEAQFRRALKEMREGRYVRAKARLHKVINSHPGQKEAARAYNYLGMTCWHLGERQRAMDAFEEARRLNPDFPEPAYNIGLIMYERGDSFHAASLLREAALVDVDDYRALEYLGYVYAQEQDWVKARRNLYDALSREPESARILTALGAVDLQLEGPDAAVALWMKALEKNSRYAPALYNLARVYDEQLKERDQALAFARQFEETGADRERARRLLDDLEGRTGAPPVKPAPEPEGAPAVAADQTPPPDSAPSVAVPPREISWEDAVREAAERGRIKNALEMCLNEAEKARRRGDEPTREKALKTAAEYCFEEPRTFLALGRYYEDAGDAASALNAYKKAVALDPANDEAHQHVYPLALDRGELDTAMVSLRRLTDRTRPEPEALWQLAMLYDRQLQAFGKALQMYRRFSKLFPDDPRALDAEDRIENLRPAAQTREAFAEEEETLAAETAPVSQHTGRRLTFKKPAERDPPAAFQAFNRGTVYQAREEWDQAIYYYTRAIENDDQFAAAFLNLGMVYAEKGENDLARDAYLYAVNLRPDLYSAHFNLALIYYDEKKTMAAISQLQSVLEYRNDYAPAHLLLGMIYAENEDTRAMAKNHYRTFLNLAPNHSDADIVREWLMAH